MEVERQMSKTYVMLGRIGDLCSILPMLHADSIKGVRHKLMVASEFISLMDGVGYVDAVEYKGPHYELAKACEQASKLNGEWQSLQIKGPTKEVGEWTWKPVLKGVEKPLPTPSFEQEPWRIAGRLNEWGKSPLVFDRRNPEREAALVERVLPTHRGRQKKVMLVSAGGTSSPFPYKELLHELLALKFAKAYRIIDLESVKADRFYDLLALFERASLLVATDSAPLHLARAIPSLPVVALTNDKPNLWIGSAWAPSHIWYCRYSDFPQRASEMLDAIERHNDIKDRPYVHVWSEYDGPSDIPWDYPEWNPLPVYLGSCGRDSGNTLQEEKRFPYVKDVLRMAMQKTDRLICLTRSDTFFGSNPSSSPSFAYRIESGIFKPVVDMFCATREDWKAILKDTPDLILGKDYWWSQALWSIFKKHGAVDVTGCVYRVKKA
jgi:hypothetical protein